MTEDLDVPSFNGRDGQGKFMAGNKLGHGNPFARRVAALRGALLGAVGDDDLAAVVRKLIDTAKAGDVAAARLLLDRVLGPVEAFDLAGRLDDLERMLAARSNPVESLS